MDANQFLDLPLAGDLPMWLSGAALFVALMALLLASGARRRAVNETDALHQQLNAVTREVADVRVNQFNAPDQADAVEILSETSAARYASEKDAYSLLWPQVWLLHDRLGLFLRAIDGGEFTNELRRDARHAALEARDLLNRFRPFCCASVEELTTHLIDTEIKAHMAACQYLDLLKGDDTKPSDHDRRVQQDKCHALHDMEARDLLTRLIAAIRRRMLATE